MYLNSTCNELERSLWQCEVFKNCQTLDFRELLTLIEIYLLDVVVVIVVDLVLIL